MIIRNELRASVLATMFLVLGAAACSDATGPGEALIPEDPVGLLRAVEGLYLSDRSYAVVRTRLFDGSRSSLSPDTTTTSPYWDYFEDSGAPVVEIPRLIGEFVSGGEHPDSVLEQLSFVPVDEPQWGTDYVIFTRPVFSSDGDTAWVYLRAYGGGLLFVYFARFDRPDDRWVEGEIIQNFVGAIDVRDIGPPEH